MYSLRGTLLTIFFIAIACQIVNADYTCTKTKPCQSGCCRLEPDGTGNCGLGPTFCGKGNCTSGCSSKSDCDPGWGPQWSNAQACPLNVCCSDYGFCGYTSDFCKNTTVPEPSCPGGNSTLGRTIGYYEGWNTERSCDTMNSSQIPLGIYSHLNFAFASINPDTFHVAPMSADVAAHYRGLTSLTSRQDGLQVWISIGGWSFNDPGPTQNTFSKLAGSAAAQDAFFGSLLSFMSQYGFTGVDIDWEYPVASERGGQDADKANFVSFLKNLRSALDKSGMPARPGLSVTLPSSYWYLRNFDIVKMDPILDWFNMMTYDLHGTWDATDDAIGSVALPHTNLTEIELSLNFLWRNNIDPAKVNMGLGFYGRSYTMKNANCMAPGCPFKTGGLPGPCTNTSGILSVDEIRRVIAKGANVTVNKEAAAVIVTWGGDQWVSYDNEQTFKMKLDFANSKCLGGTLVWAVDLDTGGSINALGNAMGKKSALVLDPSAFAIADQGVDSSVFEGR